MSAENVEIVRRGLAEFTLTHQLPEVAAPDFVWDLSTFEGWPDQPQYRGRDEFNEFFRAWVEPFDDWTHEIERIEDGGPDRVVAVIRQYGRLRGSTARVELRYGTVYTVKDRQIVHGHAYATPEEALEAVGLPR